MIEKKRPLCAAPFLGFYWRGNSSGDHSYEGVFRSCCESRAGVDELGNKIPQFIEMKDVTDHMDIMTHPHMKDMRSKLLEGEWHPNCWECKWKEEDIKTVVSRDTYNKIADTVEQIHPDIEYNVETGNNLNKLFWFDYRPSNLCNLKCRMCSSFNSSLFAEELATIPKVELKALSSLANRGVNHLGFDSSNLYDKTREKDKIHTVLDLKNVVYLKLLGGEPLLFKETNKILTELSPHVSVNITTNATKVTDEFCDIVRNLKCKRIRFQISLDGIDEVYNYIRFPGDWNKVESNIIKLNNLKAESVSNIDVSTTFVIQMWNVFQLADIIIWNLNFFRYMYGSQDRGAYFALVTQKYLHINLLTSEDKQSIIDELETVRIEMNMNDHEISRYIIPIKKMLYEDISEEDKLNDLEAFRKLTDTFDAMRHQDLLDIDMRYEKYL